MSKKALGLAKQYREADEEGRRLIVDGLPYERGFMKPPVEHRFKPGNKRSRGRPRESKNLRTHFETALRMQVAVKKDGRTKKVDAVLAGLLQLAAKASQGDLKAIDMLLGLARKAGLFDGQTAAAPEPMFTTEDLGVWHQVKDLLGAATPDAPKANDENDKGEEKK